VLLTPIGAYDKAWDIAKGSCESVDPSRSPKGAVDWEDRVAFVLLRFLIGYGEADLKFRRVEKGGRKGFQVFRIYGDIETTVGELWVGEVAYFNVSEEELRRRVEEARRTAPDFSGLDKAPQYMAWRATDVTSARRQIVATTVHSWQLRWYVTLLGDPKSFRGRANITKEGIKILVIAYWPREREDEILREQMAGVSAGPARRELAGACRRHRLELGLEEGRGAGQRVKALDWPRGCKRC
jgi:hypothetical protein